MSQRVGDLNGRWAAGFKMAVMLIIPLLPTILGLQFWILSQFHRLELKIVVMEERIAHLESPEVKAHRTP